MKNALLGEIQKLESELQDSDTLILLEEKKSELKILRQEKMKGHYIRSKMQYTEVGEKPTKYFFEFGIQTFCK